MRGSSCDSWTARATVLASAATNLAELQRLADSDDASVSTLLAEVTTVELKLQQSQEREAQERHARVKQQSEHLLQQQAQLQQQEEDLRMLANSRYLMLANSRDHKREELERQLAVSQELGALAEARA